MLELNEVMWTYPVTTVSIKNLYDAGLDHSPRQRVLNAQFMHRELIARRAGILKQLRAMPQLLREHPRVADLTSTYTLRLAQMMDTPLPRTTAEEAVFERNLRETAPRQEGESRRAFGAALGDPRVFDGLDCDEQREIDVHVDAFFNARVGLRFLVEHYLATSTPVDGWSGIIESACDPLALCGTCADEAKQKALAVFGVAPEVHVYGEPGKSFTFVPEHIRFVAGELIKNACKATIKRHRDGAKPLPPVRVVVAWGDSNVTIKVADEGGGIARSRLSDVWSYKGSSFTGDNAKPRSSRLGLPLSRLYAKYFGGTLHLTPMEGFGTDCYATFNRLMHNNNETVVRPDQLLDSCDRAAQLEPTLGEGLFDAQGRRGVKQPAKQPGKAASKLVHGGGGDGGHEAEVEAAASR